MIWDDIQKLDELEQMREDKRLDTTHYNRELTFDCFNARVRRDRVYCAKGHHLAAAKDGSMFLWSVLKGVTAEICRTCKDFEGG